MAELIDLRIGEVRTIRDITCELFDLKNISLTMELNDWEYSPAGYRPLIQFLEHKYNAPVIITNGAIQALHAVFNVLKIQGYKNLGFRIPYWNRIPEILKRVGLGYTPFTGGVMSQDNLKLDSYLLTIPNNPDGYMPSFDTIRAAAEIFKEQNIPLIHDAVYYTRSYVPIDHPIEPIGDVQIFSASKTYGLSSLRIGYMVVHNATFYKQLLDYMEFSTVGASIPSQKLFFHILKRKKQLSFLNDNFNKLTREALKKAKNIFWNVNRDHIEIPVSMENTCGPFAWVKTKTPNLFEKNNIQVLPGNIFGDPNYYRINLTAGNELLAEAVKRINNV